MTWERLNRHDAKEQFIQKTWSDQSHCSVVQRARVSMPVWGSSLLVRGRILEPGPWEEMCRIDLYLAGGKLTSTGHWQVPFSVSSVRFSRCNSKSVLIVTSDLHVSNLSIQLCFNLRLRLQLGPESCKNSPLSLSAWLLAVVPFCLWRISGCWRLSRSQKRESSGTPFPRISSAAVVTGSDRQVSNSSACTWRGQMEVSHILDHITMAILLYLKLSCISIWLVSSPTYDLSWF